MATGRWIVVVTAVLAFGIAAVRQHMKLLHLGYEKASLETEISRLKSKCTEVSARIDTLTAPAQIRKRVEELKLDLQPPAPPEPHAASLAAANSAPATRGNSP